MTATSDTLASERGRLLADYRDRLPGTDLPWLVERRAKAMEAFARHGMPTRRTEAWKYTDLGDLSGLTLPADEAVASGQLPDRLGDTCGRAVLVNGRLDSDASDLGDLPDGIRVAGLRDALTRAPDLVRALLDDAWSSIEDRPLAALAVALAADGLVIDAVANAQIEAPLEILHVGDGTVEHHGLALVRLGANARLSLIERQVSSRDDGCFSNDTNIFSLDTDATLHLNRCQAFGDAARAVATDIVRQQRGADYRATVLATGAAVARGETAITQQGKHAHAGIASVALGRGNQVLDTTNLIDHEAENGTSRQTYNGVFDGRARGVFQGTIHVAPDAQYADARQHSRALLLSDRAEVDTKPELRIHADDVQCAHGAATGQLDADALFYLRARGIPLAEARRLLLEGFVAEALDGIGHTPTRDHFTAVAADWIAKLDAGS